MAPRAPAAVSALYCAGPEVPAPCLTYLPPKPAWREGPPALARRAARCRACARCAAATCAVSRRVASVYREGWEAGESMAVCTPWLVCTLKFQLVHMDVLSCALALLQGSLASCPGKLEQDTTEHCIPLCSNSEQPERAHFHKLRSDRKLSGDKTW